MAGEKKILSEERVVSSSVSSFFSRRRTRRAMAGPGPPAPARRRRLDTLRVDDLLAICVRIPYTSHDSLRCVCRRLRTVAERSALARHRVAADTE